MTKKIFSSGIIFLGSKSNFQKSRGGGGATMPPQPLSIPMALLLIKRFLWLPLLNQYGGQLQVVVRRLSPLTLLYFYGFNSTLHFVVGSKGVFSNSKSIMG